MKTDKTAPVIAVHSGTFHADDVFSIAVLKALYPAATVVRTRDEASIEVADFAVDVGSVFDPSAGRFDHHQPEFVRMRDDGSAYASAGLVWETHGVEYILKQLGGGVHNGDHIVAAKKAIDEQFVRYLDRIDCGQEVECPGLFGTTALVDQFNPTTAETAVARSQGPEHVARLLDARFADAVTWMAALLPRLVQQALAQETALDVLRQAPTVEDGKVLVLDQPGLDWTEFVCNKLPNVLYVAYPTNSGVYHVQCARVNPKTFDARKDLPSEWAGLRDAELAQVTGVPDAVFCHKGRFVVGTKSLAGAMTLAKAAVAA